MSVAVFPQFLDIAIPSSKSASILSNKTQGLNRRDTCRYRRSKTHKREIVTLAPNPLICRSSQVSRSPPCFSETMKLCRVELENLKHCCADSRSFLAASRAHVFKRISWITCPAHSCSNKLWSTSDGAYNGERVRGGQGGRDSQAR